MSITGLQQREYYRLYIYIIYLIYCSYVTFKNSLNLIFCNTWYRTKTLLLLRINKHYHMMLWCKTKRILCHSCHSSWLTNIQHIHTSAFWDFCIYHMQLWHIKCLHTGPPSKTENIQYNLEDISKYRFLVRITNQMSN